MAADIIDKNDILQSYMYQGRTMNSAAPVKKRQTSWLIPTLVALTLLVMLYVVFLFPRDSWSTIVPYIPAFIAALLFIFLGISIFHFFSNLKRVEYIKLRGGHDKKIKMVEQIIWRNRYVLQSAKDEIMNEKSINKHQKWRDVETDFINNKVFPVIPESEITFDTVSEVINNALSPSSINSSRPPVYKVKNIKKSQSPSIFH